MAGMVMALGGNALGESVEKQRAAVRWAAALIADVAERGMPLALTHGNGPQVGMISAAMNNTGRNRLTPEQMPLSECVAMSQGYIGYHLQSALEAELGRRGLRVRVGTVITQIRVDADDPAFCRPTKPIGKSYSKGEAQALMRKTGELYKEDAGRGWRKVIASPAPRDIVERDLIKEMFDSGTIAICCGGGGIPVVMRDGGPEPVDAVIDKDYASAMLAEAIGADALVILTGVDGVYLGFNTDDARLLGTVGADEMEAYCARGCFAEGSMLPKIRAAIAFARAGGTAIIASMQNASLALEGKAGTRIVKG